MASNFVKPLATAAGEQKTECQALLQTHAAVLVSPPYCHHLLFCTLPAFHVDWGQLTGYFITSRLDYCNALYAGVSQASLRELQLVQNAAAQLLSNSPRYAHITPVLCSLHWLPIQYRVKFKTCLFIFKAVHRLAPPYLSDLLSRYSTLREEPFAPQNSCPWLSRELVIKNGATVLLLYMAPASGIPFL